MKRIVLLLIIFVGIISCNNQNGNTSSVSNDSHATDDVAQGKSLFAANCAACHAVKVQLTGPALAGVSQRWPDKNKLYRFVHNSQEVIKEDAYAKQLFEKYNKTMMTPFPNLENKDIEAILSYIEASEK